MPRRRRDDGGDTVEAIVKLVFFGFILLALAIGGIGGFAKVFGAFISMAYTALFFAAAIGALVLIVYLGIWLWRRRNSDPPPPPPDFTWHSRNSPPSPPLMSARDIPKIQPFSTTDAPSSGGSIVSEPEPWTMASIREALGEIDWFQFEKFCAALLRADGFQVERKGGAQPDGGVDLIVEKTGARALIQCKHWRTWVVQEKVIREMLGSMTHFKVTQGAIYTLKGWTEPARRFAAEHDITLVNGDELAQSAALQLSQPQLEEFLRPREHHCPKCEAPMVWRTGTFTAFWGCSRYPVCRGKFNHSGAR